jgi:hypothetical protein
LQLSATPINTTVISDRLKKTDMDAANSNLILMNRYEATKIGKKNMAEIWRVIQEWSYNERLDTPKSEGEVFDLIFCLRDTLNIRGKLCIWYTTRKDLREEKHVLIAEDVRRTMVGELKSLVVRHRLKDVLVEMGDVDKVHHAQWGHEGGNISVILGLGNVKVDL